MYTVLHSLHTVNSDINLVGYKSFLFQRQGYVVKRTAFPTRDTNSLTVLLFTILKPYNFLKRNTTD